MKCCSLHDNKEWDKDYCQAEKCCDKCPYLLHSDFPTAWTIIKKTAPEDHNEKCSFRFSEGGILCDCAAIDVFLKTVKLLQKRAGKDLGKSGGQATLKKYGKDHFKKIAKGWPKGKKRKHVPSEGEEK